MRFLQTCLGHALRYEQAGPIDSVAGVARSEGRRVLSRRILAVLGLSMTIAAASEGDIGAAAAIAFVFVIAPTAGALWYVQRCKVVCAPDGLEVVNVLRRRKVGWHELAHAQPGYYGVIIDLKGGRRIIASAVQKSNVSKATNKRTRADDLADLINRRVSGRR